MTGRQIVVDDDVRTVGAQRLDDMAADIAGAACYEHVAASGHGRPIDE
jgi:hypothetical protein